MRLGALILCALLAWAAGPASAGDLYINTQDENGTWLTCWQSINVKVYNGVDCTGQVKYSASWWKSSKNPITSLADGVYWVHTSCGGAWRCDGPVTVPGSITVPCSEVRVLAYANDTEERLSNWGGVSLNVYAKGSSSASVYKSWFNPDTYSFVLLDNMPHGSYDVKLAYRNMTYRTGGFVVKGDDAPGVVTDWDFPVAKLNVNTSGCATPLANLITIWVNNAGTWTQVNQAQNAWKTSAEFTVFPGQYYRVHAKGKDGCEGSVANIAIHETTSGISPAPAVKTVTITCACP